MKYESALEEQLVSEVAELRTKLFGLEKREKVLKNKLTHRNRQLKASIAGLKEIEENLRMSEDLFYRAFNASPTPMFICSLNEGRFVMVNQRFKEVSGYSDDEVIGHTYAELDNCLYREYRPRVADILRSRGAVHGLEVLGCLKSGEVRAGYLSAVAVDIGGEKCMIGIFDDITEKKLAESMLRESNEKYKCLVENAPTGIYEIDFRKMVFTSVNDVMCEYLGYTREEILSLNPFDILAEESKIEFSNRLSKKFAGEDVPTSAEFRIIGKDGRELWVLISATYVYEEGVPVGASVIAHNITDRKEVEQALQKSERFMANIFECIQDRLSIIDTAFNIVRANKKVEQLYSQCQPLEGRKCYSVYAGRNHVCPGCPGKTALETGKSIQAVIPLRDSGGNAVDWLDKYCYPLIDDGTGEIQGVIVYSRDITEKIKTEKEMARLERLNLVGEMAASIGHEIRNPMTAVRGFLQMLTTKEECGKYKNYFEIMIDELDRANSIISEYLSLAGNKPVELRLQSLNQIIRAILPLLEAKAVGLKMSIELELGEIPDLLLNEKDVRQLIHNLVRNGLEAMEPGKVLIIRTCLEKDSVVLSVQDQGKGMEPGYIDKVGTPFFTTKEDGTGLGLAVCYGVASRHNAVINFKTGPQGTTFYVIFRVSVN